jgi:hypothetical protein
LFVDLDYMGSFQPLGEFVDGDVEIPLPFDGLGEWPQDVQPHTVNGHEGEIICTVYVDV